MKVFDGMLHDKCTDVPVSLYALSYGDSCGVYKALVAQDENAMTTPVMALDVCR